MKDMIRTLHPEKKQGVNISKEKYEIIRKAILCCVARTERNNIYEFIACRGKGSKWKFRRLGHMVRDHGQAGSGSARPIKRVPNSRPQLVKLA